MIERFCQSLIFFDLKMFIEYLARICKNLHLEISWDKLLLRSNNFSLEGIISIIDYLFRYNEDHRKEGNN